MELALSEEQQELAATVRALLARRADSAAARAAMESERGYDEALWQTLCDQVGVAALAIPEAYGGAGFSLLESMVVLEEVGRSLAPSPLLASLVAAEALLAGGTDEARRRLLPRIAAGEVAAFAVPDEPSLFADRATVLLVAGGELVETADAAAWVPSMDQTLRLGVVPSAAGAPVGDAAAARARASLVGAVGVAALSAGLAARALEMTVAYSKERVQFGRPIGSFQALKHRMADLLVLVEMSRSASWAASWALATEAPNAEQLAHVAKSYCSDALDRVAAETVQLHGGLAITWEHDAQLVFKRAHALGQLFGSARRHRALIEL
ncbi:MAG TPA: acyl-CoA dehydrogenase family protein [Nocardioides sp.]|uniref:acyl-CoA dehydrogenase family protein n=1 Tax=Nocardioides sp. TaxID=35761 RepID=UPI002E31EA4D|nr:acyl-CoA dehydrogenase family protein [Nocardioides sp.]HEX5088141.1 acyl-CoA dehydrogenase family protein [Nocardioides sp.]